MAEDKDVALTSFNKYVKNTSTRGTILIEHLLNTGRRTQDFWKGKKISTWPGRTKEKEKRKRKESGQDLHPSKGAMKEERFQ